MTRTRPTQNALEVVAAIRRADQEADNLSHADILALRSARKIVEKDRGVTYDPRDWAITVLLLRQDGETIAQGAHRLARYMLLHAERWDDTPTLAGMRTEYVQRPQEPPTRPGGTRAPETANRA